MKKRFVDVLLVLAIIIFAVSIVQKTFIDGDTFFDISVGEIYLNEGLTNEEKLVWHEGLTFVNPRWSFDILCATIYNNFGLDGIYAFTISVTVIIGLFFYYAANKITSKKLLSFVITILTLYFSKGNFLCRGQIISFLLYLIGFYLVERLMETDKAGYMIGLLIIPFIFVNVHASVFPMYFIIFLPYIAEKILSYIPFKGKDEKLIIENRNIKKLAIVILVTLLAGFVTPTGINAYSYMFKTMQSSSPSFISELRRVNFFDELYLSLSLVLVIGLLVFTKTKIKLTDALFILGFAFMGFLIYRSIYFYYLISMICVGRTVAYFIDLYGLRIDFKPNFINILIISLLYIIFIICAISSIVKNASKNYLEEQFFPISATNYILKNVDISNMRLYNSFNYGSYLELRGIKTFIDSRAELYSDQFNEGITVLDDYINLMSGAVHYREMFDKYDITHALVFEGEGFQKYIREDSNWKLIYSDIYFSLYERVDK